MEETQGLIFQIDKTNQVVSFFGGTVGEIVLLIDKLSRANLVEDFEEFKLVSTPGTMIHTGYMDSSSLLEMLFTEEDEEQQDRQEDDGIEDVE